MVVGGLCVVGLLPRHPLKPTPGGFVCRIDPENFLIHVSRHVELAELEKPIGFVESAPYLIYIPGVLRSKRGVRADWIIELGAHRQGPGM